MFGFFSKKPPPEASKDEVQRFRRKIRGSLVKGALGDKKFLPKGEVSKLVTEKAVKSLIPQASPSLVEFVCRRSQKAFLTVLWHNTNLHAIMESFQSSGLTDKYLPIGDPEAKNGPCRMHDGGTCRHAKALDVFHDWDDHEFADFYKDQWTFCSPIFGNGGFRQELHANYILPFTWVSDEQKDGHFSSVFEAKLHADHHQDESKTASKSGQGNDVALKKLKRLRSEPGYNVEKAWESEAAALHQISELRHKHLISRKGAFKHGNECFIMFEWADGGTLRDVWEKEGAKSTELDENQVMGVLEQLLGLSGALSRLHNTNNNTKTAQIMNNSGQGAKPGRLPRSRTLLSPGGDGKSSNSLQVPKIRFQGDTSDEEYYTSDNPDEPNEEHWRHGDLKPDNILLFRDPKSTWLGTLKIADLGLAKQHAMATSRRDEHTNQKYTTSHYEAPEVITNQTLRLPRSRRYDIWSMGCIIFEFVIWLLYGHHGLDNFYKEASHLNKLRETLYFTVDSNDATARVSTIVKRWMDYMLQNDPECSRASPSAIKDLIELVRDRLLVVTLPSVGMTEEAKTECRAGADELEESLGRIQKRARDDEHRGGTYLFTRMSRARIQIPDLRRERSVSFLSTNSSGQVKQQRPVNLETYSHAQFDNNWCIVEDDSFATDFLSRESADLSDLSPHQETLLCERCTILDFWTEGVLMKETLADVRSASKTCGFHSLILRACTLRRFPDANTVEIQRVGSSLTINGMATPALSLCRTLADGSGSAQLSQDAQIGLPKLPQVESTAYYELLLQWLKDCDLNHPECRPASPVSTKMPTRLIDVGGDEAIVHLCVTAEWNTEQSNALCYTALSHPWGDGIEHDHFCTTTTNLEDRLGDGIHIDQLPETFRHAVQVTRKLGLQYLWIDSLCIVQGDGGDFDTEAKTMETIFSSAYCVIAASRASGTSSGFLRERAGRNFVRFERSATEKAFYVCEAIDDFQHDVIEGSLNKRGWVLQERALARRTIYFTESQTYWECGQGVRCETLTKMINNRAAFLGDPNFPDVATKSSKGGKIRLYESLYKQYSKLDFSKAYDRPIAIAGLEQRLVSAFQTHGGYGVFEGKFFGRSLLWKRDESVTEAMKKIDFPSKQQYLVPTWSWMAYEGAISFVEVPFKGVEWEHERGEQGIRSPWTSSNSSSRSTSWHTGNSNERIDLTAWARDLTGLDLEEEDVVYDQGCPPAEDQTVKCVIVGRQRAEDKEVDVATLEHYVLIVASRQDAGREDRYERVGAGSIAGKWIDWDKPALKVRIF